MSIKRIQANSIYSLKENFSKPKRRSGERILVTKQDGFIKPMRVYKRKAKCSSVTQICIRCQTNIALADIKLCQECS